MIFICNLILFLFLMPAIYCEDIRGITLENIRLTRQEKSEIDFTKNPTELKLKLDETNKLSFGISYLTNNTLEKFSQFYKISSLRFHPCEGFFSCLNDPIIFNNPRSIISPNESIEEIDDSKKSEMIRKSNGIMKSLNTKLNKFKKKVVPAKIHFKVDLDKFRINLENPKFNYQAIIILEHINSKKQIKLEFSKLNYIFKLLKDINNPVPVSAQLFLPDDDKNPDERDTCGICLEYIRMNPKDRAKLEKQNQKDYSTISILQKCSHYMHDSCLKESTARGLDKCPICRLKIEKSDHPFAKNPNWKTFGKERYDEILGEIFNGGQFK